MMMENLEYTERYWKNKSSMGGSKKLSGIKKFPQN